MVVVETCLNFISYSLIVDRKSRLWSGVASHRNSGQTTMARGPYEAYNGNFCDKDNKNDNKNDKTRENDNERENTTENDNDNVSEDENGNSNDPVDDNKKM